MLRLAVEVEVPSAGRNGIGQAACADGDHLRSPRSDWARGLSCAPEDEDESMDIEMIRLKSELVALETLVVALTRSLASWQPSLDKSLRATADELRERYRHLPMRGSSPETSDLVAAEFEEAWDRLMQLVLRQD
jgi:hypothetical protein